MQKSIILINTLWFAIGLFSSVSHAFDYTNSIGMEFIGIPAGSFYMGSCKLTAADRETNKKRKFLGLPPNVMACPSGTSTTEALSSDQAQLQALMREQLERNH
jgi:formylglycine-generating enzyme required for sulfatase activity